MLKLKWLNYFLANTIKFNNKILIIT
jgi:hypothetical protein